MTEDSPAARPKDPVKPLKQEPTDQDPDIVPLRQQPEYQDSDILFRQELPHPPPANWKLIQYRPRPPRGFGNDSVALTSAYGDTITASVERNDLPRLDRGRWLVTPLVDFYCFEVGNSFVERSPQRYKDLCVLSSTCWYTCSRSKGKYTNAGRIDPTTCPLDYKYVAFPMNAMESHWVLGIITHASDLLVEQNPSGPIRTSFLVLNSIHGYNPPDLSKCYPDFIRLLAMGKPLRHGGVSCVQVFKPKASN